MHRIRLFIFFFFFRFKEEICQNRNTAHRHDIGSDQGCDNNRRDRSCHLTDRPRDKIDNTKGHDRCKCTGQYRQPGFFDTAHNGFFFFLSGVHALLDRFADHNRIIHQNTQTDDQGCDRYKLKLDI